jgi:hypothetical protein
MPEPFPFDRPHWSVSVSFPTRFAPAKRAPHTSHLIRRAVEIAQRHGGAHEMSAWDADMAKPGASFGCSLAFEEGDANTGSAIKRLSADLARYGVSVEFNPDCVTYPAEG